MIMRLIDADALHDFVSEEFKDDVPYEWAWALTAVDHAPAVDAVPVVHGRWIASHDEFCACSTCKYPFYVGWNQANYCPNCDAKMDDENAHEV